MCCRLVKCALLKTSKFSNWIALVTHAAMLARSRYAPVKYTWKARLAGQASQTVDIAPLHPMYKEATYRPENHEGTKIFEKYPEEIARYDTLYEYGLAPAQAGM